jgi:hypothetical protein
MNTFIKTIIKVVSDVRNALNGKYVSRNKDIIALKNELKDVKTLNFRDDRKNLKEDIKNVLRGIK